MNMSYECVNKTNSESPYNFNKVIHKRWIFFLKKTKNKLKLFSGPIGLLIALMIYTAVGGLVSLEDVSFVYLLKLFF